MSDKVNYSTLTSVVNSDITDATSCKFGSGVEAQNVEFSPNGVVRKVSYRTFRGMVSTLKRINANLRKNPKFGSVVYTVRLPLKP